MIITIKKNPFYFIQNNLKNIEIRLLKSQFLHLQLHDTIIFKYFNQTITRIVKNIKIYNSFEDLYNNENIYNITPQIKSKENFIQHYTNIYKNYNLKKYKIIAIYI